MRIENGENNPSLYILHHLSIKLNMDLQSIIGSIFVQVLFPHSYKDKLENLIMMQDHNSIRQLIQEIEIW